MTYQPKVAVICCTYLRPNLLKEVVNSFIFQDYPNDLREMVILDDAGQYNPSALDGFKNIRLVSSPHRFITLGEKRNASAALASPDVEVYLPWDDDDIYLPWHISASVAALEHSDYTIPSLLYIDKVGKYLRKPNTYLFHPAWAFTRRAFHEVQGYPWMQSGQDQGLLQRFKRARLRREDPIQFNPWPSFIYRWCTTGSKHLSAMGLGGYEKLAGKQVNRVERIDPEWSRDWIGIAAKERLKCSNG